MEKYEENDYFNDDLLDDFTAFCTNGMQQSIDRMF
jgi:hypothetical protein